MTANLQLARLLPSLDVVKPSRLQSPWYLTLGGTMGGTQWHDNLLISSLDPLRKMGKRSLAVALGNIAKVITGGHKNFDLHTQVVYYAEDEAEGSNGRPWLVANLA
ncbi:hypothetical protein BDZ45DRAFT_473221 [Acephala macrosclerotiorum]|nr:hypothetical protein BDZ45DRAFT_473221 [Acephala macrosclerotiorum]